MGKGKGGIEGFERVGEVSTGIEPVNRLEIYLDVSLGSSRARNLENSSAPCLFKCTLS